MRIITSAVTVHGLAAPGIPQGLNVPAIPQAAQSGGPGWRVSAIFCQTSGVYLDSTAAAVDRFPVSQVTHSVNLGGFARVPCNVRYELRRGERFRPGGADVTIPETAPTDLDAFSGSTVLVIEWTDDGA